MLRRCSVHQDCQRPCNGPTFARTNPRSVVLLPRRTASERGFFIPNRRFPINIDYKTETTSLVSIAAPALVPVQHAITHPCNGCPRWRAPSLEGITINRETHRAYWRGVDINLTKGEFCVVARLVDAAGEYISYRALYDVIQSPGFYAGQGQEGMRSNVRSMIKRIRHKFMKLEPGWSCIQNFTAFGYGWKNP